MVGKGGGGGGGGREGHGVERVWGLVGGAVVGSEVGFLGGILHFLGKVTEKWNGVIDFRKWEFKGVLCCEL